MQAIPFESVYVARQCPADWAKMEGDDRVRFCQACQLNVYNLSNMNRAEAEALIQEKEGKLCIRYYKRFDGTIMTKDCPLGERVVTLCKQGLFKALISFLIFIGLVLTLAPLAQSASNTIRSRITQAMEAVEKELNSLNNGASAASGS